MTTRRSSSGVLGLGIFGLIVYVLLFIWYANTVIARPYETDYDNLIFGFLHGIFVVPSFIMSLFSDNYAIYQTPNIGGWYDFGFLVGAGVLFGGTASSNR